MSTMSLWAIASNRPGTLLTNGKPHYRCRYAAEYARSAAVDHPLSVYVREEVILPPLNQWIATAFAPGRLTATLHALQQAQETDTAPHAAAETARRAVADCERRITRYRAALDAGADLQLVATWINQAQSEKTAAQQDLLATTRSQTTNLTAEQIQRMVTELGSVKDRLLAAAPERKQPLYESLGLALIFDVKKRAVIVESQPSCTYGECPRTDTHHTYTPILRGELLLP
ncbi:hypothetical protein [Streptomyces sp. Mo3]|uniref:hypothetical protein n=1 Tax=Streptomyces sp. Mo3 TaxID=3161190 RepID=UPI0039EE1600